MCGQAIPGVGRSRAARKEEPLYTLPLEPSGYMLLEGSHRADYFSGCFTIPGLDSSAHVRGCVSKGFPWSDQKARPLDWPEWRWGHWLGPDHISRGCMGCDCCESLPGIVGEDDIQRHPSLRDTILCHPSPSPGLYYSAWLPCLHGDSPGPATSQSSML